MERLVHFLDVMLVETVVRVKYEERVIAVGHAFADHMVQQIAQRVAFADLLLVEAFDDMASHVTHQPCGVVGAVVRHQPDIHQL